MERQAYREGTGNSVPARLAGVVGEPRVGVGRSFHLVLFLFPFLPRLFVSAEIRAKITGGWNDFSK